MELTSRKGGAGSGSVWLLGSGRGPDLRGQLACRIQADPEGFRARPSTQQRRRYFDLDGHFASGNRAGPHHLLSHHAELTR